MTNSRRSILFKRMRIAVLVFLLALLGFVIFFHIYIQEELVKEAKTQILNDTMAISKEVDKYLLTYEEIVQQMKTNQLLVDFIADVSDAKVEMENHEDYQKVMETLASIKETDGEIAYVWMGLDAQNNLITYNPEWRAPDDFDILERVWHVELVEEGTPIVFTNPYIGSGTKNHIMSVVAPVYQDEKLIGTMGIDINISTINEYIDCYKVGEYGYAFLITDDNTPVMTFEREEYFEELQIVEPYFSENSVDQVQEYMFHDEARYFALSSVEVSNWKIGGVISVNETQGLIKVFDIMSVIMAVGAIAIGIIFEVMFRLSKNLDNINELYRMLQKQEKQIAEIAYIDPLTNIPNRRNFLEKLESSLASGQKGAVMLLDIDNFKEINDSFGHTYGDEVLKEVANRLRTLESDTVFISRFGGDEFLVQMTGNTIEEIYEKVELVARLFDETMDLGIEQFNIKASVGVTLFPKDSNDASQLIVHADLAMYDAKRQGKNQVSYFYDNLMKLLYEKSYIEKAIRFAIDSKQFELLYQPIVSSKTEEIKSYEALLRMADRSLSPAQFIPVAEETGLIIELGRFVTEEVVKTIAEMKKEAIASQKDYDKFFSKAACGLQLLSVLDEILKKYDVSSKYIGIEITESMVIGHQKENIVFLMELKNRGISLYLDDFGTGYASINYLTHLPVDKVKLDKFLIDKYIESENSDVVDNIIALCHSLSMEVVAEGVETYEQLKRLQQGKCDYIQGYYFSEPKKIL